MFRSLHRSSLVSLTAKLTHSRAGLAAASLAIAASAAPLMGAGPWEWRSRPSHKEIIVCEEDRPSIIAQPIDVAPCEIQFAAYQSRDTIMIFATGANSTGGFNTSLRALDTRGHTLRLQLCNLAPIGLATQCITPFSLNAAIHAKRGVCTIDVRVGDRLICVPVVQVALIS